MYLLVIDDHIERPTLRHVEVVSFITLLDDILPRHRRYWNHALHKLTVHVRRQMTEEEVGLNRGPDDIVHTLWLLKERVPSVLSRISIIRFARARLDDGAPAAAPTRFGSSSDAIRAGCAREAACLAFGAIAVSSFWRL